MIYTILKYLLLYVLGFALVYIDGFESNGGLSIGQIWKIPILCFLAYKCFTYTMANFTKARLGYAITKLLNPDIVQTPTNALSGFLKFSTLPLVITFGREVLDSFKAHKILLILSHIIILSFIPFKLGLLQERHTYIGAELLGVDSLIGPFNNAHTSSIYLSTALVFLFFHVKNAEIKYLEKLYTLALIVLGSYFLMITYVRTGYAMFAVGLCIILSLKDNIYNTFVTGIIWTVVLLGATSLLVSENEVLQRRLKEETGYNDGSKINGSGRTLFWKTSYNMWKNSQQTQHFFLGHGLNKTMQQQQKENGMLIASHNGFVDALVQNGLIGFSLLCSFYLLLILRLRHCKDSPYFVLFVAWLISDIMFQLVQGGVFFFYDIMSALIILLPILETEEYEQTVCEEHTVDTINNEEETVIYN